MLCFLWTTFLLAKIHEEGDMVRDTRNLEGSELQEEESLREFTMSSK